MKYTLSLVFLISSCINFAADTTETVKTEQKQSNSSKLLKVAIPVVAATVGVGILAYIKHQQIPDLNSIHVHTAKEIIAYHSNYDINGAKISNILISLQRDAGIPDNQASVKISYRKYFYSLFRTFQTVQPNENVGALIKQYRSNNFWVFLKNSNA